MADRHKKNKNRKKRTNLNQFILANKKDSNNLFTNFKSQQFADKKDKQKKIKHKKRLEDIE